MGAPAHLALTIAQLALTIALACDMVSQGVLWDVETYSWRQR